MKLVLMGPLFTFLIACSGPDHHITAKDNSTDNSIINKDTISVDRPSQKELAGKEITITVSFAAIACGCPQWFETKFSHIKFLEGRELFYLEPVSKDLVNANALWDGEHLPLTIQITGRFSKEKELPVTYYTKGTPERARIFWYNKIAVISSSS